MFPIPFNFPFRKKDGSMTTIGEEISEGGGGGGYTLPTASASTKGGVKIGEGLAMEGEVLNNSNPTPYSLPTASAETKGGVKVGSGLAIDENGVLSASGGGGGSSMHAHIITLLNLTGTRIRSFAFTVYVPSTSPIVESYVTWSINTFIRSLIALNSAYAIGTVIPGSGYVRSGTEGDFTPVTLFKISYDSTYGVYNLIAYKGEDDTSYVEISGNTSFSSPNKPTEFIV